VLYLIIPHAPRLKDGETEVGKRNNSPETQKKLKILWDPSVWLFYIQLADFMCWFPQEVWHKCRLIYVWSICDSRLSKVTFSLCFRGGLSPSRWSILICFLLLWNIVDLRWGLLVLFFLFNSVFLTNMRNVQQFRPTPSGVLFQVMRFLLCRVLSFWKKWRPFAKEKLQLFELWILISGFETFIGRQTKQRTESLYQTLYFGICMTRS